jgi:hypothetical protein
MLGAAAPAGAAQIGITDARTGPATGPPERAIFMVAAPGERNDVTVRASDLAPRVDPATNEAGASPLTVTVTDPGATFDTAPPGSDAPCDIVDAHTARCHAEPGNYFTQAIVSAGDGNDRLQFAPDSVPLREIFLAGDGNDQFTTGPFLGDASYRWASDMGAGNDTVHIGPSIGFGSGLGLYAGDGNDKVYAANGAIDIVECGGGQDTFVADPFDEEQLYSSPVPPCETRVAPEPPT